MSKFKNELMKLSGKGADKITRKICEIGGGNMFNGVLQIYKKGKCDMIIFIPIAYLLGMCTRLLYNKSKQKLQEIKCDIANSNRINKILSNIDDEDDNIDDSSENNTSKTEV